ncbi:MAG: hypothetical protein ACJ79H_02095 [Myxococcales bacterium]
MKRFLTLAAAAAALACGSNNTNNAAISHNNPGTGTNTLKVVGSVTAASTPTTTAPQTTFSVTVVDGAGATVNGATVTVLNSSVPDGVVNLTQAAPGGAYTGTVASYPSGDFRLNVVKGTDNVQGVVVGGVGMHTINAPALNGTATAGQPLEVTWTTPAVAKQVSVATRDMQALAPDTGDFIISGAQNPLRANQRVIITRTNEVEAAGGLLGSGLNVSFANRIDPYTVQ